MAGGSSFTTRLVLSVAGVAALVIFAGLYLDYRLTRTQVLAELNSRARVAMESTAERLGELLLGIEGAVRTVGDTVTDIPDPTQTDRLLSSLITSNPHIFASTLALDPEDSPTERGRAPYRYRRGSGLGSADLANAPQPYWQEDWFVLPMRSGTAQWVEPYFEPTGVQALMTTFSAPLYRGRDRQQEFLGVITADVTLATLGPFLEALVQDSAGFGFLLSSEGMLIGAPATTVIGRPVEAVFPRATSLANGAWRDLTDLGTPVDTVACPRDEGECRLRLRPISGSDWTLGVAYSEAQFLLPLKRYALRTVVLGIIMLGLLVILVTSVTRRLTRPLHGLARATAAVARGDLDAALPASRSNDEIGGLIAAFDAMRSDLAQYIAEIEWNAAQRSRLDGELAAAAQIQRAMLPQGGLARVMDPRVALWARVRPARAVGGDLYSYDLSPTRLLFAIGDVSDKGVAAALFMARAIALIGQWEAQEGEIPPEVALHQINESLCQNNERCMFLTLTLGMLDLPTQILHFTSAGHTPPLLLRDGIVTPVAQERGPALALQPGLSFPANRLELRPDDRLVFFTDGFDEAMNPKGESLGEQALGEALRAAAPLALEDAGERLFETVDMHAAGAPQHDDMTLLQVELAGERGDPLQADYRSFPLDDRLVAATREWLQAHWTALGLDAGLDDFRLLLEETVCNVRDHGDAERGSDLTLGLERFADRVELVCIDTGRPFDPLSADPSSPLGLETDEAPIGGLGLHLIRTLSDDQSYRRDEGRNILRLRKRLPLTDDPDEPSAQETRT